jgi:hypothetical protein
MTLDKYTHDFRNAHGHRRIFDRALTASLSA